MVAWGRPFRQYYQKTFAVILQIYADALRPKPVPHIENIVSAARMVAESGQEFPTMLKVAVFVGCLLREAQDLVHQSADEVVENFVRLHQKILASAANNTSATGPTPMDMDIGEVHHSAFDESPVGVASMQVLGKERQRQR